MLAKWMFCCTLLIVTSVGIGDDNRQQLLLDGQWQFQLDPDAVGQAERWFDSQTPFTNHIVVPGAWDVQGYGEETEKLHHNYVGKGWYKKEFIIPENWQDKHVFLCFGGVYRYAKVWVNNHYLGEHIGYVSNFEFDITEHIKPGVKAIIAVEIDSEQRWNIDTLQGCVDIIDHMQTYWGGIWGHVVLEVRADSWLENIFVQPEISPAGCHVTATLAGGNTLAEEVRLEIFTEEGRLAAQEIIGFKKALQPDNELLLNATIPNAKLWTPETPYLYTARLSLLQGGNVLDQQQTRFGLRTIEIKGTNFYLNGKKYFLNGYGDDAVYPEAMIAPSDKIFHLNRLRVAKSYGFNHVRHHSHFLPPEYYDACDEIGILVSPELPIAYMRYYNRASKSALDLYKTEWVSAIKRYRNHPSIFDWCMGNEMWNGVPLSQDLYDLAKKLDPTRPVIDSDGLFPDGFIDGTKDRSTLDFLTVMFNIITMPLDNPTKFKTGIPVKPIIAHEMGNFVSFPRMDQLDSYRYNLKPFWLTPVKEKMANFGLLDEAQLWSEKSEQLYYLSHKINIEALRKNSYITGYHWWLLQPWYTGSNGLLDINRRPNSIKPEQVRQFNGPVVLLEDGLKQVYHGGESLDVTLKISNFSGDTFENIPISCSVKTNTNTLKTQLLDVPLVTNGEIVTAGSINVVLPHSPTPQRVFITANFKGVDQVYTNEWSTWIFPTVLPQTTLEVPLYASSDLLDQLAVFNPQPIPNENDLPSPAVYVSRQPSLSLINAAEAGSCVVLLSPVGVFPTDSTAYKPAWWLGAFEGDSNAGTVVYDHSLLRPFAPEGWCDAAWFNLLQGAQTVILDDFPVQPEVLLRSLNTPGLVYPFSRYADFEFTWHNKSLLFQTQLGQGSMIVCGLNFDSALRNNGPEAHWLLTRILNYAGQLPRPTAKLPGNFIRNQIKRSSFTNGPLISGFERLISHKGEQATSPSYRELDATLYRIRQEEPSHRLEWETSIVPQAENAIFVFAGSFPMLHPPHKNPGFSFTVNDERVLYFDTTKTGTTWQSEDKKVTLLYVPCPKQPSWSITTGLFYAAVHRDFLIPGQPCRLGVRSIGSDNSRWFGLNEYTDILNATVR